MYIKKEYEEVLNSLVNGNLILCGGNGGSASDCDHFVGELIGRFSGITKEYPIISMTNSVATLTALSNDYGYEKIFIPYINAFKKFKPSFLFISTSGTSKNILCGIDHIKNTYNNYDISLLTGDVNISDTIYDDVNLLRVKSKIVQVIQEEHIKILHKLAGAIKHVI